MRSVAVVLPASMCAAMPMLRMRRSASEMVEVEEDAADTAGVVVVVVVVVANPRPRRRG